MGVWLRILNNVSAAPFTGQFNHAASLKIYEAKVEEFRRQANAETAQEEVDTYKQALVFAPDDIYLRLNFVIILEARGYLAQTITQAERCCELLPKSPEINDHTADLLVRAGRIEDAAKYFSKAIKIRGNDAEGLEGLGEIAANEQKNSEADDWFKRAIRADPGWAETYIDLGFLEQNQGQPEAALANYQTAAELDPDGPAGYFARANLASAEFQWDEAMAYLRMAVEARPEFWKAHYQLGIELAANGQTGEAQEQFAEAVRYRPDFAPARLELGADSNGGGNTNQMVAAFSAALPSTPSNGYVQPPAGVSKEGTDKNQ